VDNTPIGVDVDVDREDIRLANGTRLTNEVAEEIVEQVRRSSGRPSLSGKAAASPQIAFRVAPAVRDRAAEVAAREGKTISTRPRSTGAAGRGVLNCPFVKGRRAAAAQPLVTGSVGGTGVDVAVDRHRGDRAGLGDLGHGELAGVVHALGFADEVAGHLGCASTVAAAGGDEAGLGAFFDQRGFVLGHQGEHAEDELAVGGGGVHDAVGQWSSIR